jgi:clan AA aspartic protease
VQRASAARNGKSSAVAICGAWRQRLRDEAGHCKITHNGHSTLRSQTLVMGITHTEITLENTFLKRKLNVRALVDPGSVFMTVPQHIAVQLGFDIDEVTSREAVMADGSRKRVPMIGPLRVHFGDRFCDLSALVLGDEPLFGAVPMEMMDLVLHPAQQTLTVNPDSPYVPTALAK